MNVATPSAHTLQRLLRKSLTFLTERSFFLSMPADYRCKACWTEGLSILRPTWRKPPVKRRGNADVSDGFSPKARIASTGSNCRPTERDHLRRRVCASSSESHCERLPRVRNRRQRCST